MNLYRRLLERTASSATSWTRILSDNAVNVGVAFGQHYIRTKSQQLLREVGPLGIFGA